MLYSSRKPAAPCFLVKLVITMLVLAALCLCCVFNNKLKKTCPSDENNVQPSERLWSIRDIINPFHFSLVMFQKVT